MLYIFCFKIFISFTNTWKSFNNFKIKPNYIKIYIFCHILGSILKWLKFSVKTPGAINLYCVLKNFASFLNILKSFYDMKKKFLYYKNIQHILYIKSQFDVFFNCKIFSLVCEHFFKYASPIKKYIGTLLWNIN